MHPNHPLLHRPSFRCAVDTLSQGIAEPPNVPTQYNGWVESVHPFFYNGEDYISDGKSLIPISTHVAAFQLLMALSIGTTLQIRGRRYSHNPKNFFHSAVHLSNRVSGSVSLPSQQSILLVVVQYIIALSTRVDVTSGLSHILLWRTLWTSEFTEKQAL